MSNAEFVAFTVQVRSKFDDGSMTPYDAFAKIWDPEAPMSYEQREDLHRALELPFDFPSDLKLIVPASAKASS